MRLKADVVGIPAAGKAGPAERDRPGRARHVGVVPLLGEQRPVRRPGRALRVLEPQGPWVQSDVRDETASTQADPRAVPFGMNITGVRGEFAHQGQRRLRPRALGAVPAQADPDHPVRDRGHPHGQVVPVAGLPGEHRLAAGGRDEAGADERGGAPGAGGRLVVGLGPRVRGQITDLLRWTDQ